MSFVSSKGNILCRLINIELYKIFALINRAIKGLYCTLWHLCDGPFALKVDRHAISIADEALVKMRSDMTTPDIAASRFADIWGRSY